MLSSGLHTCNRRPKKGREKGAKESIGKNMGFDNGKTGLSHRTPHRINTKKTTSISFIIKLLEMKDTGKKILKTARRKSMNND